MNPSPAQNSSLVSDLMAGSITGMALIPDALASVILAGANLIDGLCAIMVGTLVGALLNSSQFIAICTTSATPITAGITLAGFDPES